MGNGMSNFTDFISSGGGGGGLPVNIVLTTSQTWVPPVDGNICIHVIGAGGGGAGVTGTPYSGGAGGYCKKNSLAVTTSGSFTVVVGAKGLGGNGGNGTNGGNSTVAGTGLSATLAANGATGGTGSDGAGGTASNGDVNNTGGAGNGANEGGGGAVGIYGTGNSTFSGFKRGGESDAQAEGFESLSGYGYLVGGKAGKVKQRGSSSNGSDKPQYVEMDAGPLSGGAVFKDRSGNTDVWQKGGDGGIGGGGGGCRMSGSSNNAVGGDGGSGCVIIQYLPA